MSLRLGLLCGLALGSTSAWAGEGSVQGVVFSTIGAPQSGVVVRVGDQQTVTDEDGSYTLDLEEGTWTVVLEPAGAPSVQSPSIRVFEGQVTEILWTLDGTAMPIVSIEEPDAAVTDTVEVEGDPGVLGGRITDGEGQPIEGARVFVRGQPGDVRTDADGRFELTLGAGQWDLSILKGGFASVTRSGVEVVANERRDLDVTLVPEGLRLDDFVVTAPAIVGGTADLLEERRDSASVADVIGAEQMSRSGDSSAASALARVTGLTVVGGRYVYVRGLGERYSSTLLNGANLPSPEPERRVVPLDLFPAGVLESIVIQKTFSPDMPAEFGGGTIQLRTRRVPAEPFLRVGASGTWNSDTTGREGLTYATGPTDWLGIDGDYRDLPASVAAASDGEPLEESDMFSERGYSPEELEAFGEDMSRRWNLSRRTVPLDKGLSLSGGTKLEIGKNRFGLLAGGAYADEWELSVYSQDFTGVGADNQLVAKHRYDFEALERRVKLGGLGTAAWQYGDDHELTAVYLLTRISDDEARVYEGYNDDAATDIRVSRLRWVERQLATRQLLGSHTFFGEYGVQVDWRYTDSRAVRDEPDRRETRFDLEENRPVWLLSDRPEGNQRVFSLLSDKVTDVGVDLKKPIRLGKNQDLRLGTGLVVMRKRRVVDTRRYKYMHKGERSRLDEVLEQVDNPNGIFAPENIGSDGFQFEEITRETDNYSAGQNLDAFYGLVDVDLLPNTRLITGARLEKSLQLVQTFALFQPDAVPVNSVIETSDVLPAATLTQGLPAEMQVRMGYGRTVSRPDFREMSPATFNDVTGGRQTFGNPDLRRATIDNFDLRWEWYPSPGESISVAGFAKRFTDPIEQIVIVSAQHSVTYANADAAENLGVEFDWRKNFAMFSDALEDVYVAGNVALINSEVRLGAAEAGSIQTNAERALQGQSPYVLNLQLGYADPEARQVVTLLFNRFGRRIIDVGAQGAPDTYEESVSRVDLVASTRLPAGFGLRFSAKNLTQPIQRNTQGSLTTLEDQDGFSLGLQLSWRAGG